eukprot:CAMPEP_0115386232 /NCGR_PEP_ID=MMETSP0271-20121206/8036_1 /TAXON_ID=71861 /ORGANISM="Scrippsiella trochoidea, Strain CCMP3099" /LENGTH=236 /DNA_ID=CAMNT_0002809649 /DNA_START=50 /DNA_END=761 /DNA_ORIENTATION=-
MSTPPADSANGQLCRPPRPHENKVLRPRSHRAPASSEHLPLDWAGHPQQGLAMIARGGHVAPHPANRAIAPLMLTAEFAAGRDCTLNHLLADVGWKHVGALELREIHGYHLWILANARSLDHPYVAFGYLPNSNLQVNQRPHPLTDVEAAQQWGTPTTNRDRANFILSVLANVCQARPNDRLDVLLPAQLSPRAIAHTGVQIPQRVMNPRTSHQDSGSPLAAVVVNASRARVFSLA